MGLTLKTFLGAFALSIALLAVITCLVGEVFGALFAGALARAIVEVLPI